MQLIVHLKQQPYEALAAAVPIFKMKKVNFRLSGLQKGTQLMNGGA